MTPEEQERLTKLEKEFDDLSRRFERPYGTIGQLRLINLPGDPNVGIEGAICVVSGKVKVFTSGAWVVVGTQT